MYASGDDPSEHQYHCNFNLIWLSCLSDQLLMSLIIYGYLARVTYNQVQPLRINYLATEFLSKLELYG